MPLSHRIRRAEMAVLKSKRSQEQDPIFPYEITEDDFRRVSTNLFFGHPPAPDREALLKQFSKAQVEDVWRRHYGCWQNGQLLDPPLQHVEKIDKLSAMTIEDWFTAHLAHIIRYPHLISFDLSELGLERWVESVTCLSYIVYRP